MLFFSRLTPSRWVRVVCIAVLLLDVLLQPFLVVQRFRQDEIGFYRDLPSKFRVIGEVSSEPDVRSDAQNLVLRTSKIFISSSSSVAEKKQIPIDVHGKMMVKVDRYPEYLYGDVLEVTCKLQTPPVFEKFSYAALLAKDDIFVFCSKPLLKKLAADSSTLLNVAGWPRFFWSGIFAFKKIMISRINVLFAEPEASLAAGILIGQRRAIPQNILDDFNTAGLTHVLAISGYNVSMMMTVFGYLCRNASRRWRTVGMFFGVLGLVVLTGFSASVLRAAYMGFISLFSQAIGRKGSGLQLLLLSGVIMVLLSPRMILVDLSFQLSFLSTLGLLVFMPKIEAFQAKLVERPGFAWIKKIPAFMLEGFVVTMAAQVFTTPLLLYQFGRFSIIAPIANIFVLPLVPWIMLFSFVGLAVSFVFFPLGQLVSFGAHVLIWMLLLIVDFFAGLPFAAVNV